MASQLHMWKTAFFFLVMQSEELSGFKQAVESTNQLQSLQFSIGGYCVEELLGSGAFGNVYKVCFVCVCLCMLW